MSVPFTTEVEIWTDNHTIRSTSGINISLNGLHLATDQTVPAEGSSCTVKIILRTFEHRVVIEAEGIVVHARPGGARQSNPENWISTAIIISVSSLSAMQTIPDAQSASLLLTGESGGRPLDSRRLALSTSRRMPASGSFHLSWFLILS